MTTDDVILAGYAAQQPGKLKVVGKGFTDENYGVGFKKDDTAAKDGVSERTARETRETARRLESIPKIANAAHGGELSSEQLTPLSDLADEDSDAEWAQRGPNCSPARIGDDRTNPRGSRRCPGGQRPVPQRPLPQDHPGRADP